VARHEINCEQVIETLFDFLDRELDDAAEREIERHLHLCRACFSHAEFERRLRARVAQAAETRAPETLRRRVRDLLAREP
jgi:anti-sigma factor (TIGR02949 family)